MAPGMKSKAGLIRRTRRAFTLVEVILAVAIIGLISGTFILGLGSWYQREAVDDGARRVESILRVARAEACSQGRRRRVSS